MREVSYGFYDSFHHLRKVSNFACRKSRRETWKLSTKSHANIGVWRFPSLETFQTVETNGFQLVSDRVSVSREGQH